jgi:hypothetical protein
MIVVAALVERGLGFEADADSLLITSPELRDQVHITFNGWSRRSMSTATSSKSTTSTATPRLAPAPPSG